MNVSHVIMPGLRRAATPPNYTAPPLAEYEAWRTEYVRGSHGGERTPQASTLRRIVQLRQAGDSFAEIGRCVGLSDQVVKSAYERLPEVLRPATSADYRRPVHVKELSFNAALRCLRREIVRLDDAKRELVASMDDPRIPGGIVLQQIQQCDRETAELTAAHDLLEAAMADADAA